MRLLGIILGLVFVLAGVGSLVSKASAGPVAQCASFTCQNLIMVLGEPWCCDNTNSKCITSDGRLKSAP